MLCGTLATLFYLVFSVGADRFLDEHCRRPRNISSTRVFVGTGNEYKWPNGIVPYVMDGLTSAQEAIVKGGVDEVNSKTCVNVKPRTNENAYVRITSQNSGCWASQLGYGGEYEHRLNLQDNSEGTCMLKGTVVHEILHILGFDHEQTRPDRDQYIDIKWDNIITQYSSQFYKNADPSNTNAKACSGETGDEQDNCYSGNVAETFGVQYDYGSVMHYGQYAFSNNYPAITIEPLKSLNGIVLGSANGMSELDVEKTNKAYKCSTVTTTTGPEETTSGTEETTSGPEETTSGSGSGSGSQEGSSSEEGSGSGSESQEGSSSEEGSGSGSQEGFSSEEGSGSESQEGSSSEEGSGSGSGSQEGSGSGSGSQEGSSSEEGSGSGSHEGFSSEEVVQEDKLQWGEKQFMELNGPCMIFETPEYDSYPECTSRRCVEKMVVYAKNEPKSNGEMYFSLNCSRNDYGFARKDKVIVIDVVNKFIPMTLMGDQVPPKTELGHVDSGSKIGLGFIFFNKRRTGTSIGAKCRVCAIQDSANDNDYSGGESYSNY